MAAVSQTLISNALIWMKTVVFWLKFHWNLFPRVQLTINRHCFRYWLGAGQATSHYLNQWWPIYWDFLELCMAVVIRSLWIPLILVPIFFRITSLVSAKKQSSMYILYHILICKYYLIHSEYGSNTPLICKSCSHCKRPAHQSSRGALQIKTSKGAWNKTCTLRRFLLFLQKVIQANNNKNHSALLSLLESTCNRWFPHKGPLTRQAFRWHDVNIMHINKTYDKKLYQRRWFITYSYSAETYQ